MTCNVYIWWVAADVFEFNLQQKQYSYNWSFYGRVKGVVQVYIPMYMLSKYILLSNPVIVNYAHIIIFRISFNLSTLC